MDLFELPELASYLQQDLDAATAALARDLATNSIRDVVGKNRWAALTAEQASDSKGVALDIARRLYLNPDLRRSEQIDDFSYTNATETLGGTELTDAERARIRRIFGLRSGGAFSIAPAPPTVYCVPPAGRRNPPVRLEYPL